VKQLYASTLTTRSNKHRLAAVKSPVDETRNDGTRRQKQFHNSLHEVIGGKNGHDDRE